MFRPSARSRSLLCLLLTSAVLSHRLSTMVAHGQTADLPGYCAFTFTLMPVTSTNTPSVQVLDFESVCPLIRRMRLICASCSSGQRFAFGFLQIPPRGGHPCRSAHDSPCRGHRSLALPSECALPGAQSSRKPVIISPAVLSHHRTYGSVYGGS